MIPEGQGIKINPTKALSSNFPDSESAFLSDSEFQPGVKSCPKVRIFELVLSGILFFLFSICLFLAPGEFMDRFLPGLFALPGFTPPSTSRSSPESSFASRKLPTPATVIVDSLKRKVVLPSRVTRLISLQPEITRIVVALGAGQTLLGIDRFLRFEDHYFSLILPLASGLPLIALSDESVNAEVILRFRPELVFTSPSDPALTENLSRKLSIPVVALSSLGRFDLLFEEIEVVGRVLGREARARELLRYFEEKLIEIKTMLAAAGRRERPRVYLAFWSSLVMTPVNYDPVSLAGGQNLAEGLLPSYLGTARTVVSPEQILEWNPEIILIHGSYPPADRQLTREQVLKDRRLASAEAVKRGQVFYTFGFWYWWDPAEALFEVYYLVALFYPELRPKLDLEKEGEEIFTKFYGSPAAFHRLLQVLEIELPLEKEAKSDGNEK